MIECRRGNRGGPIVRPDGSIVSPADHIGGSGPKASHDLVPFIPRHRWQFGRASPARSMTAARVGRVASRPSFEPGRGLSTTLAPWRLSKT